MIKKKSQRRRGVCARRTCVLRKSVRAQTEERSRACSRKGHAWVHRALFKPCLVDHPKIFHPSQRIFGHMHGTLNIDKK